jgi:hypothetical protein
MQVCSLSVSFSYLLLICLSVPFNLYLFQMHRIGLEAIPFCWLWILALACNQC